MNCANHADSPAVAYCRTCGKALCANCTRPVRGVIYCEECLGARMEGSIPPTPPVPPTPPLPPSMASFTPQGGAIPNAPPVGAIPNPPNSSSGPNPTVAGILAGFFPFGVGPVYNGQYAKGLAYLITFALLIAGCNAADNGGGDMLGVICGLGLAFFYVYQIIDSVRSARAIQTGQPAPDPFGLAQTFSAGDKFDAKRVPMGAIVLILLGVLFLLHTMGLTEFGLDRFWPIFLILLGGWMFAANLGLVGDHRARLNAGARSGRLMGPALVLTIGVLFLISTLGIAHFGRTWPVILLVIGAIKLMQRSVPASADSANAAADTSNPPPPPVTPVSGEVDRG